MTDRTATGEALALPGPAAWVRLIMLGAVRPSDGRAAWELSDPQGVIRQTRALGNRLVVDYDHQTDHAANNGRQAPAAGWITGLERRADGIYGHVEWTARARRAIADREYRFISPVFQYTQGTRRIVRLLRAGLTNNPALDLSPLALASANAVPAKLDATEAEICRRMGIAPADFAATRDRKET